jgi:hypothetical protein
MTLHLTIKMDNAAFRDDSAADEDDANHEAAATAEAARILRDVADKLDTGLTCGPVFDCNGNRVGGFNIE